jgi:retron-type reverse transcriptase
MALFSSGCESRPVIFVPTGSNPSNMHIGKVAVRSYFDSIPHAELMKSVARRIVDGDVLHLIKQWLDAPVEEDDGHGGMRELG